MSENLSDVELNQWIHENLFRECWHDWSKTNIAVHFPNRFCYKCGLLESRNNSTQRPGYCENISDAWKVVEALRLRDWMAVVKDMPDGIPHIVGDIPNAPVIFRRSCAIFSWMPRSGIENPRNDLQLHAYSFADTPARAICEAAKLVVEADAKYYNN